MAYSPVFVAVLCVAIGVALAYPQAAQTSKEDKSKDSKDKGMFSPQMAKCGTNDFKLPKWDNATLASMETCYKAIKPNATAAANSTTSGTSSSSGTGSTSQAQTQVMPSKDQFCQATICSMQKIGIADSKGMPVKANITAQIQAMSPSAKLTDITTAVNGCLDKHSSKLDMTKCDTYEDLFKCIHVDVGKVCDWKDDMP